MSFCFLTGSTHKFDCCCSNVHIKGESYENLNPESLDPAISVPESETDLAANLIKFKIDTKIRENNHER